MIYSYWKAMAPTAWIYSIQFKIWSPQLHQHLHLHSTCHLNNKTYPANFRFAVTPISTLVQPLQTNVFITYTCYPLYLYISYVATSDSQYTVLNYYQRLYNRHHMAFLQHYLLQYTTTTTTTTILRLSVFCPGLPGWASVRKVKPKRIWISWSKRQCQWCQMGHMQTCTSPRQITMPAPYHSFFYRLDALPVPSQQRQSTEGNII